MSSLHYVHRCKARSLGRPWSANAEASSALVRGVFRASLSTAHLSPGSRGHRSAGSLLGAGIRVTGSRFLAWSSSVLRARLGGIPATRLLGCARSGSGLLACSAAAQPFNQPDTQRRATFARFGCFRTAVACRLSQTLGIGECEASERPATVNMRACGVRSVWLRRRSSNRSWSSRLGRRSLTRSPTAAYAWLLPSS